MLPATTSKRLSKSALFAHFAEHFEIPRRHARDFFEALAELTQRELKRAGIFVLPGMVTLKRKQRRARQGRNPATGQPIQIPAKTVLKARVPKSFRQSVVGSAGPISKTSSA